MMRPNLVAMAQKVELRSLRLWWGETECRTGPLLPRICSLRKCQLDRPRYQELDKRFLPHIASYPNPQESLALLGGT
jgi:hypothetical protein